MLSTLNPGDGVRPGTVAGVVSNRPYFLLPAPLALYRDLRVGDRGLDVTSLQNSLAASGYIIENNGVVDWTTMDAVQAVFQNAGFFLPLIDNAERNQDTSWEDQFIPFRQLLALPGGEPIVTKVAPIASEITGENPLLEVRVSKPFFSFTADVMSADSLEVSEAVSVKMGADSLAARITNIGEFTAAGAEGSPAGRLVTVELDDATQEIPANQQATVTLSGEQQAESLAVPATAVRVRDNGSNYVITKNSDPTATPAESQLDITVLRSGGGYVAIEGELVAGDQVKVS